MNTDYEEMFERAPVSLWLEDYTGLHALFQRWRAEGVTDLRRYLTADHARVTACSQQLKVVRVNRRTLELFGADSVEHLTRNLDRVFRDAMIEPHIDELVALWDGKLRFASQTVNYSLNGDKLDILVNGSVLPGHEADWSRVLVAIEDVTQRTRAERSLAQPGAGRALCARIVRGLAGLAVGRGFQRDQAADRRRARPRHRGLPRVHAGAPRVRRTLHAGDPRH
jgi:PAS domain-containing protein